MPVPPNVYASDNTVMLQALRDSQAAGKDWRGVAVVEPTIDNTALAAPGFQALLRLLASGRGWVKLTGPYRISALGMPHDDVTPFARALVQCAPHQVMWGSGWPHVMHKGPMPNDGDLADLLTRWVPDKAQRRQVLVDYPARLYGL